MIVANLPQSWTDPAEIFGEKIAGRFESFLELMEDRGFPGSRQLGDARGYEIGSVHSPQEAIEAGPGGNNTFLCEGNRLMVVTTDGSLRAIPKRTDGRPVYPVTGLFIGNGHGKEETIFCRLPLREILAKHSEATDFFT